MKKGKFIVFEGPDGTGKDTILSEVAVQLTAMEKDFVVFKDPSPEVAGKIREILLNDSDLEEATRLYLYLAARSELLHKQIIPALKAGKIVLCNRYILSTYCYQGIYFNKMSIDIMHRLGGLQVVKPDLQIVLLAEKSFREPEEEDAMGKFAIDFRKDIIARYVKLAKDPKEKIQLIWVDNKTVADVLEDTMQQINQLI